MSGRLSAALFLLAWAAIPLVCWWGWGIDEMEDWLIKNVMPIGLLWNGLCLGALVCFWNGRSRLAALAGGLAIAVGVVANPTLSNWLMGSHEAKFPTRGPDDFDQPLDAVCVLGGVTQRLPSGRVEVNSFGQRIVSIAEFWHAGKTNWIVTTGGVPADGPKQECKKNADLLASLGVPAERILQMPARNTSDEMRSIKKILSERASDFPGGRIGLVTCAFHMPRAMRLARSNGLDLVPLPGGHRAVARPWQPSFLIPDANALLNNSLLAKEWLAMGVGR
ncbi:MAG: YdcF family protein [Bythopirellula sp.]